MKQIIRQLLERCGYAVVHRNHAGLRFLAHPPTTAFESVLHHVFPTLRNLAFVQVGANDGNRADPIASFIDSFSWGGLMLEPLQANFADLRRLRGGNPRLRLKQAAVDVTFGKRTLYDLDPAATAALPDWTRGLASFSRDRVERAAFDLGLPPSAVISEEIEAVAWQDVWRDFGPRRCDVLVLDTEGYDLILLRAADLGAHRPRVIHFEHACVTADDRLTFYRELTDLGYEIATDGPDTTAWLPA